MKPSILVVAVLSITPAVLADPPGVNEQRRTGYPLETSHFAKPSDTGRYIGYTVGGGALRFRKAEPAEAHEGTWGWDYTGGLFQRRVNLGWWHGRRYQGGSGAYRTDGPRILRPIEE